MDSIYAQYSSYAPLNQTLNYNTAIPKKSKSKSKNNFNRQHQEFPKYQNNTSLSGYDNNNNNYYSGGNSSLAIGGLQMENSPVSEMYFSRENMKRIQKKIKKEILAQSDGKFRLEQDQDEMDLLIAMRAVFLENTKNLPGNIVSQVKELNELTIDYIVPDMMTNIRQQIGYMKDITTHPTPMDRPLNVNRAGRKTLPSATTIWGF